MDLRPWIRRSIVLGALAATASYAWYRRRVASTAHETRNITERHASAFLVRRPIDEDRLESVREAVAERCVDPDDPRPLLGLEGAATATLFLDAGDDPELIWYVEVPHSAMAGWENPESRIEAAFPLEDDALVAEEARVDRELLVHAVNPNRPRTAMGADDGPLAVSGAALENGVDIDLVQLHLKPGLAERLADRFAGLSRRVAAGEIELGPVERWSAAMLETEAMYTESVVLERRPEGYVLCGYMETAEMAGVYDAYYDTWNPVARASELVFGRVLEEPAAILEYPLGTGLEVLAHAVAPDRPRRPETSQIGGSDTTP
ncbi:uncharacterized protein Nmag_2401 [Natrialba magadii ATCC 43099]|uniref:Uncharacterized protein n=1 Tax=Natrialba magadii (strain ATCC 43099 / DSM 3394 / CCM 3739 / CIP 104546 / IAM 13178 / JCM 8861 / NBRC 102185 / NCIMB 2190 / MS3) TaxID=547559 RepID=D3SXL3_NATMM|nr:hypothetical protein [Natrialba magadii]ADD05962.1 uncharacterized protein Nmag_2401 [Natrialba magadii ATCC 43099]ELY30530.1 hypothetical protein C500_08412 [Natrialba magadii ATCC 43099]